MRYNDLITILFKYMAILLNTVYKYKKYNYNIAFDVVTATFKNVKKGTYYAGLHAFNRTSEDGKKVFSQWSNVKKVNVK